MTPRSLHIACTTWEQVEAIYERKLRRGNLMSIKVPFAAASGEPITLGLELPSRVVVAIDGAITRTAPVAGSDKHWIEVELVGLTADVVTRLRRMVDDARAQRPTTPAVSTGRVPTSDIDVTAAAMPSDERRLFLHLSTELRQLRARPAHAVLQVEPTVGRAELRRSWLALAGRYHPDVFAARRSAPISQVAEELAIHLNRAYERCRAALGAQAMLGAAAPAPPTSAPPVSAADRRTALGVAVAPPPSAHPAPLASPRVEPDDEPEVVVSRVQTPPARPPVPALHQPQVDAGSDALGPRVRALLGDGRAAEAREQLAAALTSHPRSKALRALYHLTSAVIAIAHGQLMLAQAQLETAIGHEDELGHAAALLHLVRAGRPDPDEIRRIFR